MDIMKRKHLFLTILFLFTVALNFAQGTFTQSGIAVQGIVRDNNNTAITSGEPISITFTIYYDDNGTIKNAYNETKSITPDSFGVFSHEMNVPADKISLFSEFNMVLKIESQIGNNPVFVISDEPLKYVPYAISANNGVPVGSVMPYLAGGNPPTGWVFCKGQPWGDVGAKGDKLKALLNNPATVPNLQGMFLRGAGDDGRTQTETVALRATQEDSFKSHLHAKGTLATANNSHTHTTEIQKHNRSFQGETGTDQPYQDEGSVKEDLDSSVNTHNHVITGSTASTGNTVETRPINYGVNYIIKL